MPFATTVDAPHTHTEDPKSLEGIFVERQSTTAGMVSAAPQMPGADECAYGLEVEVRNSWVSNSARQTSDAVISQSFPAMSFSDDWSNLEARGNHAGVE